MGPHQGRVEGKENLPQPVGHTPLDAPQDAIGLLGNQGTLLAQRMSNGKQLHATVRVLVTLWKLPSLSRSTCTKPSEKSACPLYHVKSLPCLVFNRLPIDTATTEGCISMRHSLKKLCMLYRKECLQLIWNCWQSYYFCTSPSTTGNKFHRLGPFSASLQQLVEYHGIYRTVHNIVG